MTVVRRSGAFVRIPIPARELNGTADEIDAMARDGVDLFLQAPPRPRGVILYVHGKSSAFCRGMSWWLPLLLERMPVVHASASMRSHSLGYSVRPAPGDPLKGLRGGMWEDVDAGAIDIASAIGYLAAEYNLPIWIVGHSAGGFYAVTGAAAARNELAGRVLLSPLVTHRRNFAEWFGDAGHTEQAITRAREMVAAGHGHLLIPLPTRQWAISAWSLVQRAEQDPDVWPRALASRQSPVLMGWGSAEELRPNAEFQGIYDRIDVPEKSNFVLKDSGHNYEGYEHEVAGQLEKFILQNL